MPSCYALMLLNYLKRARHCIHTIQLAVDVFKLNKCFFCSLWRGGVLAMLIITTALVIATHQGASFNPDMDIGMLLVWYSSGVRNVKRIKRFQIPPLLPFLSVLYEEAGGLGYLKSLPRKWEITIYTSHKAIRHSYSGKRFPQGMLRCN